VRAARDNVARRELPPAREPIPTPSPSDDQARRGPTLEELNAELDEMKSRYE